jgi:hypothetical protein
MLQDLANNIILFDPIEVKHKFQLLKRFKVTQRNDYFCAPSRLIFILFDRACWSNVTLHSYWKLSARWN